MKSVISASRRTDIPAFYLDWFMETLRNGSVTLRNPMYPGQTRQVNLNPEQVGWIVFWSRNYAHFLRNYRFFEDYNLFFHFTILSSSSQFQPKQLSLKNALSQTEKIVSLYGPERIIWRYDPIIIWEKEGNINTNFKKNEFEEICRHMSQMQIQKCYISFVTPYQKVLRRLKFMDPELKILNYRSETADEILKTLRCIADRRKIQLYSCSNDGITGKGIARGSCISGDLLNRLSGCRTVSVAKTPGRKDCGCTSSIDIGNYDRHPCMYGCAYCYANPVVRY